MFSAIHKDQLQLPRSSGMTSRAASFNLAIILIIICVSNLFLPCSSDSDASSTADSVLEYYNGPRRDGVYVDSTMTKASASAFHIDPTFKAQISGAVCGLLSILD